MPQTKLEEWISPQEAALTMSIRKGVYVSPDDVKQLRNQKRFPDSAFIRVSERQTIYKRSTIDLFDGLTKRNAKNIDADIVAVWLWEFPCTIEYLEKQGFHIPCKAEALRLVATIKAKQANPKKKAETGAQAP